MIKLLAALPFIAVITILYYPVHIFRELPQWSWLVIGIFVVFAIIQIVLTYTELEEEFEDEHDEDEGFRGFVNMVRFSTHRTFRQYLHSAFVPVHGEVPFVAQVASTISRRFKELVQ